MTVLVSGSSGLIGTALLGALAAEGREVVRLVRPGSGAGTGPRTGATVTWDPGRRTLDREALRAAGPYEAVVHLAGTGVGDKRWSPARKAEILHSRTDSTGLLVSALLACTPPPPVLVSASAIGYYGDRGDEVLDEGAGRGAGFLADVVEAWEGATAPASEAGIRVVLLRTGLVLSPAGGVLGRLLPLFKWGIGGRIGPGTQYQSWIALDDEVAVIGRALADDALRGPVNAVAPTPVTNAELTTALSRALHRPAVLPVPSAALRLGLGRQMADEMLLASQRVSPAVLQAVDFPFRHTELDEALASLLG